MLCMSSELQSAILGVGRALRRAVAYKYANSRNATMKLSRDGRPNAVTVRDADTSV